MAGRSATVANRNWEEWGSLLPPHPTAPHSLVLSVSIRAWPNLLQRNLCAPLEFHWLEIAIVSYIHIGYRRPFREFLGFRTGSRASRRKKKRKSRRGRGRAREKRQRQRGRRTRSFCTVTPPIPKVAGNASNAAISSISFRFALKDFQVISGIIILFFFFELLYYSSKYII